MNIFEVFPLDFVHINVIELVCKSFFILLRQFGARLCIPNFIFWFLKLFLGFQLTSLTIFRCRLIVNRPLSLIKVFKIYFFTPTLVLKSINVRFVQFRYDQLRIECCLIHFYLTWRCYINGVWCTVYCFVDCLVKAVFINIFRHVSSFEFLFV